MVQKALFLTFPHCLPSLEFFPISGDDKFSSFQSTIKIYTLWKQGKKKDEKQCEEK